MIIAYQLTIHALRFSNYGARGIIFQFYFVDSRLEFSPRFSYYVTDVIFNHNTGSCIESKRIVIFVEFNYRKSLAITSH